MPCESGRFPRDIRADSVDLKEGIINSEPIFRVIRTKISDELIMPFACATQTYPRMALMPGSSLPSMYSSMAPPPVDT